MVAPIRSVNPGMVFGLLWGVDCCKIGVSSSKNLRGRNLYLLVLDCVPYVFAISEGKSPLIYKGKIGLISELFFEGAKNFLKSPAL